MKKISLLLISLLMLGMLAACGDESAENTTISEEGKSVTDAVGGPFDEDEFMKFLKDLPTVPGLTAHSEMGMGDGMALPEDTRTAIKDAGWQEARFLYIYSHATSVLNLDQLDRMQEALKKQFEGMPEEQRAMMEQAMGQKFGQQGQDFHAEVNKQVPAEEQEIVRAHMEELRAAMGI